MTNIGDEKKKNISAENKNEKIIQIALNGITLLRADLIDEFRKSIEQHDKDKFKATCKEAGINDSISDDLYAGLTDGFSPTEVDVWV